MVVYASTGRRAMLLAFVRQAAEARLFVNDFKPTGDSARDAFIEPTAPQYQPATVLPAAWTVERVGREWQATHPEVMWLPMSAEPVVGYFVLDGSGAVLWSERFDKPITADQAFVSLTQATDA